MKALVISYNADAKHWDNTVLLPAYPSRYGYFRPFRYDLKYVSTSLRDAVQPHLNLKKLDFDCAIVCMRFSSKHANLAGMMIPIRKIEIVRCAVGDDGNVYVYFRLGAMVDYASASSLEEMAIRTDPDANPSEPTLMRTVEIDRVPSFTGVDSETLSWQSFARLVATSKLPIDEHAKCACYVRLASIESLRFHRRVRIRRLRTAKNQRLWGPKLSTGSTYSAQFYHTIPWLRATDNGPAQSSMKFTATGNLILSADSENLTGGTYGEHSLSMTAGHTAPFPSRLKVSPPDDLKSDAGEVIVSLPFELPIQIGWSLASWIGLVLIPLLIAWFGLTVIGLKDVLLKAVENGGGRPVPSIWDLLHQNLTAVVIVVVASFFVVLFTRKSS